MEKDIIIVGGGIVGLSTAYQIIKKSPDKKILILEKESGPAQHQTGNNSGVIHSGLYYKPGSLKAENCIRGYHMLIQFCKEHYIPFEITGKVVVATSENEIPYLDTLKKRGLENGLSGLKELNSQQIKEYEPYTQGVKGIFVPQTGIVDYRVVAEKLSQLLIEQGVDIRYNHKILDIQLKEKQGQLKTSEGEFTGRQIINCAGLFSDKIAAMAMEKLDVKIIPFRGEYYKLTKEKEHLVNNLIYPVPNPNFPFLGVHFTRMMKGGVEAGPNAVLAFSREGYKKRNIKVNELFETLMWPGFQKVMAKYWKTGMGEMYRSFSKSAFTKALQKLIPEIKESDLVPGGSGVRAQACDRKGGLIDDFLIFNEKCMINVCNAPSPAATSSLSIGTTVAELSLEKI